MPSALCTIRGPVEYVRLIYEQIETAKAHLLKADVLDCRLALIILDNTAELLMARELKNRFDFEDFLYGRGPARRANAPRPNYTTEERERAQWEFEPKLRVLGFRMGKISPEERAILKVCHRLRNEAFHAGALRRTILTQATILLFQTTVGLTVKLPIRSFTLPGPRPSDADRGFLERFELPDAMLIGLDEGREQIARKLMYGIALDQAFAATLAADLIARIDDDILGGLQCLAEDRDADIDYNLQHTQFWQDQGARLMDVGVREPKLSEAYEQWKAEGRAKYTVSKIKNWRRQAELIARRDRPSAALEQWWAIDEKIQPLETDLNQAVAEYDDRINAEIHDRKLR